MTIDRRQLLATGALAATATALPAFAQGAPSTTEDARLLALFDAFFNESLEENPEQATSLGLDTGARAGLKSRLSDQSAAAKARRLAAVKDRVRRMQAIDRAALSPARALDYDVVRYDLDRTVAGESRFTYGSARGNFQPYVISQQQGAYRSVPDFLDSQHRVTNAADADAYLARLDAFATVLDQQLDRQMQDAARGVAAPDFALDLALAQLKALREVAPEQTILAASLVRKAKAAGLPDSYGARAAGLVGARVFPAFDRHIKGIAALRAKASNIAGVWRLPDGEAYYAEGVKSSTTTNLTPAEVHQLGLDQVADLSARLDPLLKAQGLGQGGVGARLAALNARPDQLFANDDAGRAALLALLNEQIKAFTPLLSKAFLTLPKAPVEVRRVPAFIQDGASNGYYQNAALDGSRPAAFYINLKDTYEWPRFGLPTLAFHETVPGHHLQVGVALETPDTPLLRRRGFYSAYSEGWALYAEQVADELGAYDNDPLGRIGYLQSFLFRAARLVVDTGIHFKRWSRNQATDYMTDTTGFARGRSQREVERYCVGPAQALSYKVGHTQWARLREQVKARQGAAFDQRQFHEILRAGAMPLVILEREVMRRA